MLRLSYDLVDRLDKVGRVGLLGSCNGNDFRIAAFANVAKVHYIWRINTISLMGSASQRINHVAAPFIDSERKTFYRDLHKSFSLEALASQEIVILDFLRDVYDVGFLIDGGSITIGQEIHKYNLLNELRLQQIVSPFSPEYPKIWFSEFEKFVRRMSDSQAIFCIVALRHLPGRRFENAYVSDNFDAFNCEYKNKILAFMEQIASILLPKSVLVPFQFEAAYLDASHEYGLGPVHYGSRYYASVVGTLRAMPDMLIMFNGTSEARLAAAEKILLRWEDEAAHGYYYE
jgi:hypothetical protein